MFAVASYSQQEVSGAYYDWTKTMQPETPWKHNYNQTLVNKLFLCSRDSKGGVGTVYLTFKDALDVIRRLDNITLGLPKIVYLVGWQFNGHDSKYPAWTEVNNALKREEDASALASLKWLIKAAKAYHTTVSLHVNMIDAFEDSPLWEEYLQKNIIAKDINGNPLKGEVFDGMTSYQISYKQEWDLGYAQKRIDGLLKMLPELIEGGTIQIDAFHSMRPNGVGETMSPYLGYTIEDEIATQRKIFRYFQSKGIDVTSEGGMYWLRKDPFIGLQAMTWNFGEGAYIKDNWIGKPANFTHLPMQFAGQTPMKCESEIKNDSKNLSVLVSQFCTKVVPWYYERYQGKKNKEAAITNITKNTVIAPILWKDKALLAYTTTTNNELTITIPKSWGKVSSVQLKEITPEGLKPISKSKVINNTIALKLETNRAIVVSAK